MSDDREPFPGGVENTVGGQALLGCPDGGRCHHECAERCWRVDNAGPLSGVYPGDEWPATLRGDDADRATPATAVPSSDPTYDATLHDPLPPGGLPPGVVAGPRPGHGWVLRQRMPLPEGWVPVYVHTNPPPWECDVEVRPVSEYDPPVTEGVVAPTAEDDNEPPLCTRCDAWHDMTEPCIGDDTPAPTACTHPNAAWTVGGPEDSDGYVWCPDCRTNLSDDTPAPTAGQWTVTVSIRVNEEVAQGDEADLAWQQVVEAFDSFGLRGVSIAVGPLVRAGAAPDPTALPAIVLDRVLREAIADVIGGTTADDVMEVLREQAGHEGPEVVLAPPEVGAAPVGDDTPAPTAGDRWFVLPTGALLYGDGKGGSTVYGVLAWGPEHEDDRHDALEALGAVARDALNRAGAAPDLTALTTAETTDPWLERERESFYGQGYADEGDTWDAPAPTAEQVKDAGADTTWGPGNWIRCSACPRDAVGATVYHHKDAHGAAPDLTALDQQVLDADVLIELRRTDPQLAHALTQSDVDAIRRAHARVVAALVRDTPPRTPGYIHDPSPSGNHTPQRPGEALVHDTPEGDDGD